MFRLVDCSWLTPFAVDQCYMATVDSCRVSVLPLSLNDGEVFFMVLMSI